MKSSLRDLIRGDVIQGRVEEILPRRDLIISFQGTLLRVNNETQRDLKPGANVTLVVQAVQPLRFRLLPSRDELKRNGRIDVNI